MIDWMAVALLARTGEDLDIELHLGHPTRKRQKEIHDEMDSLKRRIQDELER